MSDVRSGASSTKRRDGNFHVQNDQPPSQSGQRPLLSNPVQMKILSGEEMRDARSGASSSRQTSLALGLERWQVNSGRLFSEKGHWPRLAFFRLDEVIDRNRDEGCLSRCAIDEANKAITKVDDRTS